jgi:heme exporter protein C
MFQFANPKKFYNLSQKMLPYLSILTSIALFFGLYFALFNSPPDYQQGESVRLMYVHVPAAWFGVSIFVFMAMMSGIAFVWRHPIADILAQESASIGATYTGIALITGSLWGKVSWGTYWVWDARLTSVLVLFFLYLAYIALKTRLKDKINSTKTLRFLALIGFLNIPIIKGSVQWWASLHQPPSLIRAMGVSIHTSMLIPLLLMALGFGLFFLTILLLKTQTRLLHMKALALLKKKEQTNGA